MSGYLDSRPRRPKGFGVTVRAIRQAYADLPLQDIRPIRYAMKETARIEDCRSATIAGD